jgi:hypothetical protein
VLGNDDMEFLRLGPNFIGLDSDGITFDEQPKLAEGITPSAANDIATKKYVDDKIAALLASIS